MAFAWGERVRQRDGKLEAENVQVPAPFWRNGTWRASGRRLGCRVFVGYARRVPVPRWFACDALPPLGTDSRAAAAALELRLRTTPLGRMCRHFEIRQALAQDKLADDLAPALYMPDLLSGEDRLEREWKINRPASAAQSEGDIETIDGLSERWPTEVRQLRRRLRCAALRRLDAAATGREVYLPCPAYFGDPYVAHDLAPGLSLKSGLVRRAGFWPSLEGEKRSQAWRADRRLVAAVETLLFPVHPASPSEAEDFAAAATAWLDLAALRNFEAFSALPLFPHSVVYPDDSVPPGFRVRIRSETMRSLGGSYLTLAALGLSPYIAEPFYDYCAKRREALASDMEDVAGLALAKWGGLSPAVAHDVLQSDA